VEPKKFVGDNSKLKSFIDWKPEKSLEEGLKELLK
jgi:nucleoside-diphosphate-sugar epimerase